MKPNEKNSTGGLPGEKSKADYIPFSLRHDLFHPGAITVTPPPTAKASKNKRKANNDDKTNPEQFLKDASLEKLLPNYKPSRLSQQIAGGGNNKSSAAPIPFVKEEDILFGRGTIICNHHGNVFMRKVIALNQPFYRSASRQDKQISADCLVRFFENRGTRFLERVNGLDDSHGYVPVVYERVVEKFMQALREKVKYRHTGIVVHNEKPVATTTTTTKSKPAKRAKKQDALLSQARQEHMHKLPRPGVLRRQLQVSKKKSPTVKSVKAKDKCKTKKAAAAAIKVSKKVKIQPPRPRQGKSVQGESAIIASQQPQKRWDWVETGDHLGIFWDLDRTFYPGVVEQIVGSRANILYHDNEREWVDLASNKFILWTGDNTKNFNKNKKPSKSSSRENSIQTQDSTDSEDAPRRQHQDARNKGSQKRVSICIQGTYTKPMVAPSACLVTFLRRKLQVAANK